jgi:hypothetical protein
VTVKEKRQLVEISALSQRTAKARLDALWLATAAKDASWRVGGGEAGRDLAALATQAERAFESAQRADEAAQDLLRPLLAAREAMFKAAKAAEGK